MGLEGLAGLAQGFAESYNQSHKDKLNRELDERHQLAKIYLDQLPNLNETAQPIALQTAMGIFTTPSKDWEKAKKKYADVSGVLGSPPPGYGQQSAQAPPALPAQSIQSTGMGAPETSGGPPQLQGTMAAMPNMPGMSSGIAQPLPPPYTPWLSQEEKNQILANQIKDKYNAEAQAGYDFRKKALADLPPDVLASLSPAQRAQAQLGGNISAASVAHYQSKQFEDPEDPTQPITLDFNPIEHKYYYPGTDTEFALKEGQTLRPYSAMAALPTPARAFIQSRIQSGKSLGDAVDEYNNVQGTTSGIHYVVDPITGDIHAIPFTNVRQTTRGTQGGGTVATPPPASEAPGGLGGESKIAIPPPSKASPAKAKGASSGGGRVVDRVTPRAPADVRTAQSDFQDTKNRLSRMRADLDQIAKNPTGNVGAFDMDLLSQHIAMTFGSVKGARTGEELIQAHIQARSLPENLVVAYQRLKQGQQLSQQQRENFMHLGETAAELSERKYLETVQAARGGYGLGESSDLKTPPPGSKVATKSDVQAYATQHKMTYAQAEKAAKADGYTIQ